MHETLTEQIVDDAALVLQNSGRMFDVVDIGSDGTSILGSSNMYTRYWAGILSVFDSPDELVDLVKSRSSIEFEGGLACAKLITNSTVIVGLDTGSVSLVNIRPETDLGANVVASVLEHDDVVSTVSVSGDGTRALTGSYDRSLKVWHTDYLVCSHTYRPAHADMVVSAAIHPEQNDVMVSCSEDGRVIIWDLRMSKPALGIGKERFANRPSCVAFVQNRGVHNLLVGTISGHLLQLDASLPKASPVLELGAHSRAVRSICPAPGDNGEALVASCADDCSTVVSSVDPAHPQIIYSEKRHTDVVRGLAWTGKDSSRRRLYTCGWDRQVIVHELPNAN